MKQPLFYSRNLRVARLGLLMFVASCSSMCESSETKQTLGLERRDESAAPNKPRDSGPLRPFDTRLEALKTTAAGRDAQYKQALFRALPALNRARAEAHAAFDKLDAASSDEKPGLQTAASQALAHAEQALSDVETKLAAP